MKTVTIIRNKILHQDAVSYLEKMQDLDVKIGVAKVYKNDNDIDELKKEYNDTLGRYAVTMELLFKPIIEKIASDQ